MYSPMIFDNPNGYHGVGWSMKSAKHTLWKRSVEGSSYDLSKAEQMCQNFIKQKKSLSCQGGQARF
jgi:hypothetical protein